MQDVPDTVGGLVEAMTEADSSGARTNALWDRLVLAHGHEKASSLWSAACREMDADAEFVQAVADMEAVLDQALTAIAAAQTVAAKLAYMHVEYSEGDAGDTVHHLDDAARAVRASRALYRAAKAATT